MNKIEFRFQEINPLTFQRLEQANECAKWANIYNNSSYYVAGMLGGIVLSGLFGIVVFYMMCVLYILFVVFHWVYRKRKRHYMKLFHEGMNDMGELAIIDETGDTKVLWDKTKQPEVDAAKSTFKKLKKQGYLAYTVKDNGDRGEVINTFDVNLERIIMHKPVIGG